MNADGDADMECHVINENSIGATVLEEVGRRLESILFATALRHLLALVKNTSTSAGEQAPKICVTS